MQNCIATAVSLVCAFASVAVPVAIAENSEARPVSFVRDVAPILVAKCQGCHGQKAAESNYRLDSFEAFMQAGDFATPPVTPGDLDNSEIYRLITAEDSQERMPNNGSRLSGAEIRMISDWIVQGAKFDGQDAKAPLRTQIPADVPHPPAPQKYHHALPVTALAFTADGGQLVVSGYHELLVWDAKSGALVSRVGNIPQRVFGMAYSPDYSWLAIAGGSPGAAGEVQLIPCPAAGDCPNFAESAEQNGTVPVAESAQPKVLATHDDVFFAVAFRSDGSQLAAAGTDGTVRIFDAATGAEKLRINSHADWVTSICFSPDGNRIATASRDKTAKVFDASTGNLLATFSEHGVPVRAVAFAPDGKSVLSGGGNRLCIWNADDAKLVGEMVGFSNEVQAIMSHGDSVVAASADRSVRQFKLADRLLIRAFSEQPAPVVSLAWHPASNLISVGCFDGTVAIMSLETGATARQFTAVPDGAGK